jgi:hypothetical protein
LKTVLGKGPEIPFSDSSSRTGSHQMNRSEKTHGKIHAPRFPLELTNIRKGCKVHSYGASEIVVVSLERICEEAKQGMRYGKDSGPTQGQFDACSTYTSLEGRYGESHQCHHSVGCP